MQEPTEPRDPLDAVVHPDPYPYYARLRKQQPLYFDEGLKLWVATTAPDVEAALRHVELRVRPPAEPVPRALAGTPAGEVFGRLVRMNDGDFHARHKPAVQRSAARFTLGDVARAASDAALDLSRRTDANALLSAVPVQAMARLLGVPAPLLDSTTRWVEDFVQGIGAQASSETVASANEAARELMAQGQGQGLDAVQSANRIAMMQQALDATAGLIGNAVRSLHLGELSPDEPIERWRSFVAEVARWDAPVQNTRRFAAAGLTLAGLSIELGQGLLLVLASANRDEGLNRDPDAFDTARADRRSLTFGAGVHGCPGEAIATEIAAVSLKVLQAAGRLNGLFGRCAGFRPLPNARIPVFETGSSPG